MLLALLGQTLAADQAYAEVVDTPTGFLLVDEFGHELHPDEFAKVVGDERTRRAYHLRHTRLQGACWMLWGGGIGFAGAGVIAITMTPLADSPEVVALSGVGLVGVGVASAAAGSVTYAVGRRNLNEPTSWYTRDSAIAWTENE